mmetsp:Transcript_43057/g.101643  ORF Transcript_43057/g.101643 Transcript_43057/m.101643 type:complete len:200 (-) Transcript_43057:1368-1967(-)
MTWAAIQRGQLSRKVAKARVSARSPSAGAKSEIRFCEAISTFKSSNQQSTISGTWIPSHTSSACTCSSLSVKVVVIWFHSPSAPPHENPSSAETPSTRSNTSAHLTPLYARMHCTPPGSLSIAVNSYSTPASKQLVFNLRNGAFQLAVLPNMWRNREPSGASSLSSTTSIDAPRTSHPAGVKLMMSSNPALTMVLLLQL